LEEIISEEYSEHIKFCRFFNLYLSIVDQIDNLSLKFFAIFFFAAAKSLSKTFFASQNVQFA